MVITIQDKDLKDSKEKNAKKNQHRMWYIKNLLPKVFQSKGDVVNFDPIKIEESIIKETNMDIEEAKLITEKVVRRIISSNIKFLSGPHIRELVCSVLSEQGFENERKLYTRIGMPLMDYERLLYKGTKENANQFSNPESIHNWSADSLAEEYALLRLLTTEQSHAHLSGDIHVHMLRYFDLRPFCVDGSTKIPLIRSNLLMNVEAKEFDQFFTSDEPYIDVSNENFFFMTPSGPHRLRLVTRKKADPIMYKIITNKGKEIILSKEHGVIIFNDSILREVQVKYLNEEDKIKILDCSLISRTLDKINLIEFLVNTCPQIQLENVYVKNLRVPLIVIKQQYNFSWNDVFQHAQILEYPRSWERGSIPILQALKLIETYTIDTSNLELGVEGSPYTLPVFLRLDNDLLRLIGYFVSDGNYNIKEKVNYNLVLTNNNPDILEDMELCIKNSFSTFITYSNIKGKTPQLFFGGKLVYLLFRYVFGIEPISKNKTLSNLFLNISDYQLKSLLTGLYTGDGHIIYRAKKSDCSITYTSKSKNLIDFLSLILSTHNIRHTIKEEHYEYNIECYHGSGIKYRLHVYGYRNIKLLSSIMGFKQREKQKKIMTFIDKHQKIPSKSDSPYEFIIKIVPTQPTHSYIYDFSLEGDGNWEQNTFYAENILIHNCQEWDLRLILKYGLPPTKTWSHSACSGPAKSAMVAMLHAAKWLGIVQGEFSGGQGYDNFTTMIVPYISGLNEKDIKQAAQCFIFETNQIFAARGGQVPFTSISCTPTVPKILEEIDAIGIGGTVVGKYGDFKDETLKLFNALTEIYYEGDGFGKLFAFPKHEIKLKKEWMIKYEDAYLKLMEETAKFGTPYFLNTCADWLPDEVHSQCCRIILTPDGMRKTCDDPDAFDWTKSYMNMGSLQSISVNLPRVAYQANGDDDKLFEILGDRLNMMKDINLIKLNIIKQRLKDRQLPLCASVVDGNQLLDMRKQTLSIGFTGLNEMVQYHTGQELHESDNAYNFGKKVLQFLSDRTEEFKYHPHNTQKIKFSLWEEPAESSSERFARLDLKHYENKVIYRGTKDSPYYTNSGHLNYDADIPLFERILKQAEFHPIIKGGVITHLWMGEQNPDPEGLWQMTKKIAFNTKTAYFAYTFDFSYCTKCGLFIQGVHDECSNPKCDGKGKDIEIYSRITGYYSPVDRWNKGKAQEFKDRKRYGFI